MCEVCHGYSGCPECDGLPSVGEVLKARELGHAIDIPPRSFAKPTSTVFVAPPDDDIRF